jgi:hypothetical protein
VDAAPSPERSFCTTCGWLLPAGSRATCAACGGDGTSLPLVDNTRPLHRDEDEDPALGTAKESWAQGDHARSIGLALTLPVAPRGFSSPQGPGWVAAIGPTPVFAFLDVASSQVTLEVPVARLPQTKRVPALRAALAMCAETASTSRICLRLDLLVARFAARLDALSPALVRKIARELAVTAARAQEQLAAAFDARPAIPEQGVMSAWDRLGRAQPLPALAPPSAVSPPSSPEPLSSRPPSRPSSPGAIPSFPARPITLRLSIPPSLAQEVDDSDMPAVLAPDFAEDRGSTPSMRPPSAPPPSYPPPSRPPFDGPPPSIRPSMLPSALPNVPALGLRQPFPSSAGMRTNTPQDMEAPPPSRRAVRPPPQDAATPEGRLCELLRQALALATALSFEEKPCTMLLLVRAAVFRAVQEHAASVPNAVHYLYRATRHVTREIWMTKPDPARAAIPIPVAEPALGALEQILAQRANVPREKPASIEPWTTAQQAKENLGKFLTEIELSPPDPTLRHYLALGALSELLCRTRLPPQTEQRLHEIVAYAQRDGAKPQVIELMMTALRKIVSG